MGMKVESVGQWSIPLWCTLLVVLSSLRMLGLDEAFTEARDFLTSSSFTPSISVLRTLFFVIFTNVFLCFLYLPRCCQEISQTWYRWQNTIHLCFYEEENGKQSFRKAWNISANPVESLLLIILLFEFIFMFCLANKFYCIACTMFKKWRSKFNLTYNKMYCYCYNEVQVEINSTQFDSQWIS